MKDSTNIEYNILRLLKESEKPISTREIALKIKKAWHTIDRHCLKLQLAGKIDGYKISNINVWVIKR